MIACSPSVTNGAVHLKKDGTPDMRYKVNRTLGRDKDGSLDKDLKRKIKAHGAQHDISQKNITIMILQKFLKENADR